MLIYYILYIERESRLTTVFGFTARIAEPDRLCYFNNNADTFFSEEQK